MPGYVHPSATYATRHFTDVYCPIYDTKIVHPIACDVILRYTVTRGMPERQTFTFFQTASVIHEVPVSQPPTAISNIFVVGFALDV